MISETTKSNITVIATILGAGISFISVYVAYKNYIEGKEQKELQKELTRVQLIKAKSELGIA